MSKLYKKMLEQYEKKYVPIEKQDPTWKYRTAREILEDMQYLNSHNDRTKKSSYFDFKTLPTMKNKVYKGFWGDLFRPTSVQSLFQDRDGINDIIDIIIVFEVTKEMLRGEYSACALHEWANVFEWYTDLSLIDQVCNFLGCSLMVDKVKKDLESKPESFNSGGKSKLKSFNLGDIVRIIKEGDVRAGEIGKIVDVSSETFVRSGTTTFYHVFLEKENGTLLFTYEELELVEKG